MDVAAGSSLRLRKRHRGNSSSSPAIATSTQQPKGPRLILGEFSEQDTANDLAIARRLNELMVQPADRQRFIAPTWKQLADAYHSNLALVSSLFSSAFPDRMISFVTFGFFGRSDPSPGT